MSRQNGTNADFSELTRAISVNLQKLRRDVTTIDKLLRSKKDTPTIRDQL